MSLDDAGSAANPPGFGDICDRRPSETAQPFARDKPPGVKPAAPIGLVEATLAASACLLTWGLALALIGIAAKSCGFARAGLLTILEVV